MEAPEGIKKVGKLLTRAGLAAAVAVSLNTAVDKKVSAQSLDTGLAKYGRILLWNANQSEGGTSGYGGLVQDPQTGQVLICTISHVAEGGPVMADLFQPVTEGDDPVSCMEVNNLVAKASELPEISREQISIGDSLSVPNSDGETDTYTVSGIDDTGKVWFAPNDTGQQQPTRGDSGTFVGNSDGDVVGVFGGERIAPNRDDPDHPTVTLYMIPFGDQNNSGS